ncbi:hypothetical protein [Pseudomonas fluorescens]
MQMIALNKSLFSMIYEQVNYDSSSRYHACVETTDDDKQFIKKIKSIRELNSLSLKVAVLTDQDDELYLAVVGSSNFSELPPEVSLQRLDETAGVITVLGGGGLLKVREPSVAKDKTWTILPNSEKGGLEGLSYVSLDEILELLEEFSVYKIESLPFNPVEGEEDRFLLMLLLLLGIGDAQKLELKQGFLEIIMNVDGFPFHLLHSSYISQTWRYAYVDFYRCVELLYPLPRILDLRNLIDNRTGNALAKQVLAIDLFKDVYKATGWRESEAGGLERLIKDCSPDNVTKAFAVLNDAGLLSIEDIEIIKELSKIELTKLQFLGNLLESISDMLLKLPAADQKIVSEYKIKKSATLVSNVLYATRNELVHFRQPKEIASDVKIVASFKALMCLMADLYQRYKSEAYGA